MVLTWDEKGVILRESIYFMKKTAILFSVVVLISIIGFFGCQRMTQIPDIKPAELQLENLSGIPVDLSFMGDRPVVIYFWSTTSEESKKALPDLKNAYTKHGNQVNFMLVSDENSTDITTFKSLQMLPFFMFRSTKSISDYGIHNIPTVYFFDSKGNISSKKTGILSESELETEISQILKH